jgi:hypothetical protein
VEGTAGVAVVIVAVTDVELPVGMTTGGCRNQVAIGWYKAHVTSQQQTVYT